MTRVIEYDGFGGVLLAAGASRRMGRNKMLLELDGEPLVRRAALRVIAAGLAPLLVVIGQDTALMRAALNGLTVTPVENPDYAGPSSVSLHRGLDALGPAPDAAVVLLGDMVHVTTAMVTAVTTAARRTGARLVVSRYGEVPAPPLLFHRSLFPELYAWSGEGCGRSVVQRHREEAVFVDWPADWLADVDTPDDFRVVAGG